MLQKPDTVAIGAAVVLAFLALAIPPAVKVCVGWPTPSHEDKHVELKSRSIAVHLNFCPALPPWPLDMFLMIPSVIKWMPGLNAKDRERGLSALSMIKNGFGMIGARADFLVFF